MAYILGAIAELGGFVGGSVVEATGSEALGQLAGGAVAGEITSRVEGAIDTATSSIIDSIFGPQVYENKKKQFYNSLEEAKSLGLFSENIGNESAILQTIKDSNYTENDLINQIHNFSHDFSDELSKKGETLNGPIDDNSTAGDILAKLSQINPVYYYLVNKLLDKSGELVVPQNDPEYEAIAKIYNGKGQYSSLAKQEFDGTNMIFSEVNEIGELDIWKYPEYNNYTVVPSLWGVYTGINSVNNQVPLRGIVNGRVVDSFLDAAAFRHDCSYFYRGSFNKFGDYQLISRISQNKDKLVFPGEALIANIAVNYFSTLGALMRKMMGPEEETPIIKELFADLEISEPDLNKAINTKVIYGSTQNQLANMLLNLELELD